MNANYGLFPPLPGALRGRDKKLAMAERALGDLARWGERTGLEIEAASCQSVA
jgi:folate-dependent tRNA-U54 methylase TrmFO/GidA